MGCHSLRVCLESRTTLATIPPPTTWAASVPPLPMGCERTELGANGSHSTSHLPGRLVAATRRNRVHSHCGLVVPPQAALHPALRRRSRLWLRVHTWCDPVRLAPTVARFQTRTSLTMLASMKSRAFQDHFMNTPLQRGDLQSLRAENRFNGFPAAGKPWKRFVLPRA